MLRLSHSLLLACSLFSVAASTTVATTCCTKRCACAEKKKNYMNTIFTIIWQLRGACVCVFLTKFCWIIKCTFYALFLFFLPLSALSTNFHLLWGTARRVTYNFWVRVKSERSTKQNEKNRRKLQTAHVQICTNTFLSNCMTVCVKVQAPLEKIKAQRLEDRMGPYGGIEIHPLIASIRQETLSWFELNAVRSRKQKPTR